MSTRRNETKPFGTIDRILITSDPLMTKETEQYSNRRWMKDILRRPVQMATGIEPQSLASSRDDRGLINRRTFFEASGIRVDLDETQFWFDDAAISDASLEYLRPFIGSGALVIGYEMSPQTRALLERLAVPYIDIWLHPVRFLDDILFAFNSNVAAVRDKLFAFDVPGAQMHLYADRIRVQTYKGWRRIEAKVKPNSALFVGQMQNDKSVCHKGRMLSLLDYQDRFEQIADNHSIVYYSRHPYMRGGDEAVLSYIADHPKAQMIDTPSYRLLSSGRIQTVFGISSSVIQEARYFDKATEYLYRPILRYGDRGQPEHFASILQDFVSPHFWSDVLSPLMETADAPRVEFRDKKDKLRDMLGFYWSYPDIDKTEHLRRTVAELPRRGAAHHPPARSATARRYVHPAGFTQTSQELAALRAQIDRHATISFDIFDTLIERLVDKPNDLFELMAPAAKDIAGPALCDFHAARRAARDLALDRANGEEVLLRDRYQALDDELGLPDASAKALYEMELDFERAVCVARYAGRSAFDYARARGKRVILTSDIFFDRAFVEDLLRRAGYEGWDRLYLSSEAGVLKQTGRLFDHVLREEDCPPSKVLHIGDNAVADIKMAAEKGLSTFHLPDKRDVARRLSTLHQAFDAVADAGTRSVIGALVAREATRSEVPRLPGISQGDAERLGYAALGPALWGFARWIAERAKETGVTDLYFLARDGDIAKRCYDIVTNGDASAPTSHYLLASRRAVNVAQLQCDTDIAAMLEANFTPCSLDRLLKNRFGICGADVPQSAYADAGYRGPDDIADWHADREKLVRFAVSAPVAKAILANAGQERKLLKEAYFAAGLGRSANPGFVDIGHSGSLQSAITKVLGMDRSQGFYFCTKSEIDGNLAHGSHHAIGYVADRLAHSDCTHPYQRHILMFELMFQNTDGSFLCYRADNGGVHPRFIDVSEETARTDFIRKAHDGACRFTEEIKALEDRLGFVFRLDGPEAIAGLSELFRNPWPRDAGLFEGIDFENRYSSRETRWIVPPKPMLGSQTGLWREGCAALQVPKTGRGKPGSLGQRLIRSSAVLVRDRRKREKLLRDPSAFFRDSRKPGLRLLGHLV